MEALKIPSPVQVIDSGLFSRHGIQVWMKRDDLIHPDISGNKWRKLKYNIIHAQNASNEQLLTFGGAFSNHIAATAAACKMANLPCVGLIRGEEADLNNPTLSFAINNGMKIIPVSRQEYAEKEEPIYIEYLHEKYPNTHIVPEGGANYFGVNGCMEIVEEIQEDFDTLLCAVGTGTTLAGLAISLKPHQKIIGFPAIKGGAYLTDQIKSQIRFTLFDDNWTNEIIQKIELVHDYSFGGFAKTNDALKNFRNDFLQQHHIDLDLVYTAKMMYGFYDLIEKNKFPKGSKIMIYHSGGLQGNLGLL